MAYKLPIRYIGQVGAGSNEHRSDCGASCVAMLLRYAGITVPTVDNLYNQVDPQGDSYLSVGDLLILLSKYGIKADWDCGFETKDLWEILSRGKAPIALIRYGALSTIRPNAFAGSHFVVVVGLDLDTVYIHDPLNTPTSGSEIAVPLDMWDDAWSTVGDNNPQRSLIVPVSMDSYSIIRYVTPTDTDGINVRSIPGDLSRSTRLYAMAYGSQIPIYFERDGWGKISATEEQWISLDFVKNYKGE